MNNHIKAVFFDLDGTLRHSVPEGGEVFTHSDFLRALSGKQQCGLVHRGREIDTSPSHRESMKNSGVLCRSAGPAAIEVARDKSGCSLSRPCIHELSASERGVDAASLSLLPQLSLNSNLVGSFTLKRPQGASRPAPMNRQLPDAPLPQRPVIAPLQPGRSLIRSLIQTKLSQSVERRR